MKPLRLVNKTISFESITAHQDLVDRAASGAARQFLKSERHGLTVEEIKLLSSAKYLDLDRFCQRRTIDLPRLRTVLHQTRGLRGLNLSYNLLGTTARDLPTEYLRDLEALKLDGCVLREEELSAILQKLHQVQVLSIQ